MAKLEHDTDEWADREEWRLTRDTSKAVWALRVVGVVFLALAMASFIQTCMQGV